MTRHKEKKEKEKRARASTRERCTQLMKVLFFFSFFFVFFRSERGALFPVVCRDAFSLSNALSRGRRRRRRRRRRETFDFSYARESVFFPYKQLEQQQQPLYESAFISYVSLIICRVFFSSRSSRSRSRSCKNKDFAARMPRRAKKKSSEKEEERVGIVGFVWRKWRKNVEEE